MAKDRSITLDKKALVPLGAVISVLFVLVPAITFVVDTRAAVQAQGEEIESVKQDNDVTRTEILNYLKELDGRTRNIELDVQAIKTELEK